MKSRLTAILITTLFCIVFYDMQAQNCSRFMEENQFANGMQLLKSKKLPLVIRGGYKYNLQLTTDERGRIINVQSVAGKKLRIGHEVVFVGSDGVKKPFTFLEIHGSHCGRFGICGEGISTKIFRSAA